MVVLNWQVHLRRVGAGIYLFLFCFLASGCGSHAWPETYPVTGKVVYQDGKPLTNGLITFTLVDDSEKTSTGQIESDGTFTLNTVAMAEDTTSKVFTGRAEAGEYYVTIWPYPGGPGGGRGSYTLKKKYSIEATETNEITVQMEPYRR